MHCCDAFSLSQSVLSVGSQDVAWIWERRPAPARFAGAPVSPRPMLGGRDGGTVASTGPVELTTPLSWLSMSVVMWCATPGDAAARPVSAATAGGGEDGKKWAKLGNTWAPLPWLDATASSPASSAMVSRFCCVWLWDFELSVQPYFLLYFIISLQSGTWRYCTARGETISMASSLVSLPFCIPSLWLQCVTKLSLLMFKQIIFKPTYKTYGKSHTFATKDSSVALCSAMSSLLVAVVVYFLLVRRNDNKNNATYWHTLSSALQSLRQCFQFAPYVVRSQCKV